MPPLKTTNVPSIKLFSSALKAYVDSETGRKRISCVASSTVEDLHGDEIASAAVASMAQQAIAKGMTIFLNHSYDIPEDVFGSTVDASASKVGIDPKSGKDIWELNLSTDLNEANPRAVETYKAIDENGINIGVSIGALIRDWEFRDAKKQWEGGLLIKDLELLEASMVGIPANPRSWVKQAVRAIRRSYTPDEGSALVLSGSATAELLDDQSEPDDDLVEVTSALAPVVTDAACPSCGGAKSSGDCDDDFHGKDVTPEVTASTEPDTDDESEPEAVADDDEETTSPVDLEAAKTIAKNLSVTTDDEPLQELLLGMLETAAESIKELRAEVSTLTKANEDLAVAASERDTLRADLDEAMQVLALVAKAPLVRKTSLRNAMAKSTFQERYAGVYDQPFLRLLDDGNDER